MHCKFRFAEHILPPNRIYKSPKINEAVKLMTIHASKGLEFPFVYCPNIVRAFNNRDASGNYIVSKDFGILLPKNRTDDYSKNFVYELFKQKETSKGLSEYMRLFYVQLTRATSKIIFISPKGSGDSYESIDIPTVNRTILTKTAPNSKGEMETKIVSPKTFNDFLNYAGKDFLKKKKQMTFSFATFFFLPKVGAQKYNTLVCYLLNFSLLKKK